MPPSPEMLLRVQEYTRVVGAPDFRLFGFNKAAVLALKHMLQRSNIDTDNLTIADFEDYEIVKKKK